jgi:hypothetical protein
MHRHNRNKQNGCSTLQLFVASLISIAVALLITTFQLTQQLPNRPAPPALQSPNSIAVQTNDAAIKSSSGGAVTQSPYNPWPTYSKVYDASNTPGVLRNNGAYAQNRIYCMVPFVWRKDFYDIIMATWGKRCDQIYFFTDAVVNIKGEFVRDIITGDPESYKPYWEYPEGTFPDNVVFMNMTRSWDGCTDKKTGKPKICRHIWEKMWRSWVYVADNHIDRAEWFCKIDYDTFFFPENLQYYVQDYKKWDAKTQHHYFGHLLYYRNIISGSCACWSHKTLVEIADVYRKMPKGYMGDERNKCEDRSGATEEVTTSKCLRYELKVEPEEAIDDNHRDFFMTSSYEDHLDWNRTKQGELINDIYN